MSEIFWERPRYTTTYPVSTAKIKIERPVDLTTVQTEKAKIALTDPNSLVKAVEIRGGKWTAYCETDYKKYGIDGIYTVSYNPQYTEEGTVLSGIQYFVNKNGITRIDPYMHRIVQSVSCNLDPFGIFQESIENLSDPYSIGTHWTLYGLEATVRSSQYDGINYYILRFLEVIPL
jgi:hypothetical protein